MLWETDIKEAVLWDPENEGLCGYCGGECQIVDYVWSPWGLQPKATDCPRCGGSGKLQNDAEGGGVESVERS